MMRFIIRLFFFVAIMLVLDRGFGWAMMTMQNNAKGGYVGHHNYIVHQSDEDILIFGSSRAIHHYNPQIITDSLGLSCYNCGQDGNGIVLFYGWWQLMKDRHCPKMIIYDVTPSFDLLMGEDNHKYLGWLRSEYDNESVKQVFEDIDPTEKFKMQSMMYRYNSKFLQIITDFLHPVFSISSNGYLPVAGEMEKMKIRENAMEKDAAYVFDSQKLAYLKSFIEDTKSRGIKLVFVASPIWYGMSDAKFVPLEELCKKESISFYNFSNDKDYVRHDEFFKDGNHLNAYGADEFSKEICTVLKRI